MGPRVCCDPWSRFAFRAGAYDDEDWAYGEGYYASNWADIDEDADIGIINMPYDVSRRKKRS
jgi:hypothetical protein